MDDQGDMFDPLLSRTRDEFQRLLVSEGGHCPVCDRWGKVYKRPLNATMVKALAWIWRLSHSGRQWVDVPEAARNNPGTYDHTKQYSTLKYWGFLDHKANVDKPEQKESGVWKPTVLAGLFLMGKAPVPLHVYTYNDELRRKGHEVVYVRDIIDGFDYRKIMLPL